MIVSLEGSRRSGKTFMADSLSKAFDKECVILPDEKTTRWLWANTPPLPMDDEAARYSANWFFEQTAEKYRRAADPDKLYLFQRDYVSPLSFTYAYSKFSKIGHFDEQLADCRRRLASGEFRKPDLRLVLDNNLELFLQRAEKTTEKTIEDIWHDKQFSEILFSFYRSFASDYEPENSIILEPNISMEKVKSIVGSYIQ